jgi:mRNA interferase MazF
MKGPRNYLNFEQRDIFVLELPFSDLSKSKLRPVLIVSNDDFNRQSNDVVVLKITGSNFGTEYEIKITNKSLEDGKLRKTSYVDSGFIMTIEKQIFLKKIGKLNLKTFDTIKELIIGYIQ